MKRVSKACKKRSAFGIQQEKPRSEPQGLPKPFLSGNIPTCSCSLIVANIQAVSDRSGASFVPIGSLDTWLDRTFPRALAGSQPTLHSLVKMPRVHAYCSILRTCHETPRI